jgi:hypothetical protein
MKLVGLSPSGLSFCPGRMRTHFNDFLSLPHYELASQRKSHSTLPLDFKPGGIHLHVSMHRPPRRLAIVGHNV